MVPYVANFMGFNNIFWSNMFGIIFNGYISDIYAIVAELFNEFK